MRVENSSKNILITLIGISLIFWVFKLFISSSPTEKEKDRETFKNEYKVYAFNIPPDITFADEEIPLNDWDVKERLDRELLVNTYWQSNTLLYFKRANRYFPVIEKILDRNNIPEDLKYIALIESGFMNVVSPAGAAGFWQLLKSTGQEYGLEVNDNVDERYHLEKSTEAACKFFKESYDVFGNWMLVAASYNMGINGIKREVEEQKVQSYFDLKLNPETSRYIFRLLAIKEILEHPKEYGFHFKNYQLYQPLKCEPVVVNTSIDNLVDFAIDHNTTYKMLKEVNPWLRQRSLKNPTGKVYTINIPLTTEVDTFVEQNEGEIAEDKVDSLPKNFDVKELTDDDFLFHKVTRDEDIYSIAEKYQVKVSEILQWNNMNTYHIKRGQKIKILKTEIKGE